MTKVFISYSRKDKIFAGKLTEALEKSELETWIDWEDIPPTADWMDQIHKGIEQADAFLFILSADSVVSKVCGQEVDYAVQNGKRLIPIVARDVNPNDVHPALAKVNWIYSREQDDFDGAVNRTLSAIRTDLAWVEAHRRLQVRALEWDKRRDSSLLLRGKDLREAEEQLASAGQKDPQPTDLQRQYILESRRGESRTRNVLLAISAVVMVVLVIASVIAIQQSNYATSQAATAVAESNMRGTAEANAVSEANTRATAQADALHQKATAIANEQEAKRQAQIAFARQLAAQAEAVSVGGYSKQTTAVLLAIKSMQTFPTLESSQFLQNQTLALPAAQLLNNAPVEAVAYSPDGRYVVSGGKDGTVRVWDIASGQNTIKFLHDGAVTFVAFSPDGAMLITGSDDKTVRTWNILTGKEIARVSHSDRVKLVSISLDGKYVLSSEGCEQGDPDGFYCKLGSARVWEAATGKEIIKLTHNANLASAAFSPDGKHIVSGGGDGIVRVWDLATGVETASLAHGMWVSAVVYSPSGNLIASAGCDRSPTGVCTQGSIRIWSSSWSDDFKEAKEQTVMMQQHNVISVAFSPDSWKLVSLDDIGSVRMWEVGSGQEILNISAEDGIKAVVFSKDGNSLASYGGETGRVWDTANGKEITCMLLGYDKGISSIAFSPDSNYVVSGNRDGTVSLWHAGHNQFLSRLANRIETLAFDSEDHVVASDAFTIGTWNILNRQKLAILPSKSQIDHLAFSKDLKHVVLGDFQNNTRIWEIPNGREILRIPQDNPQYSLAFSPDGAYISSGSQNGVVQVWEVATGKEISHINHQGRVSNILFSPDGKSVASVGCEERSENDCLHDGIIIWEASTGQEIVHLNHEGWIFVMAFSPDGKYLVSGGCDKFSEKRCMESPNSAHVWEVNTGREVAQVPHAGEIRTIAFSPDGRYVVSGGEDKTARVWDAMNGQEIAHMTHDANISVVAFSPDSKYVVSGGRDSTARVWDANTGKELGRMKHDSYITSAVFSSDGKYLASGSEDGIIRVWVWRPEDLISEACQRVSRNLTRLEWQLFIGDIEPYRAICPNLSIEPEATVTPTATP